MRRTKATLIYRHTKNLRAVQLLLGNSKLESTVRYLGIEVDDRSRDLRAERRLRGRQRARRNDGSGELAAAPGRRAGRAVSGV